MALIPSTNYNEWSQQKSFINMAMEKPNVLKQDQKIICTTNVVGQLQALKCPRCDSSNTKFCYYNNYSLTQPRHFCKACKRYWTRGGTLRNVPVGGSCRKNKRIRSRPSNNIISSTNSTISNLIPTSTTHMEHQQQQQQPMSSNPFFYNTSDLVNHLLYPNPTDLGLGFSPLVNVNNNSLLSSYNININNNHNRPMFSSSSTSTTGLFDQQKPFSGSISNNNGMNLIIKQDMLKTDQEEEAAGGQNRLEWSNYHQLAHNFHNQMESDSSLYNWNTSSSINAGSWLDPLLLQNINVSSVPSLI